MDNKNDFNFSFNEDGLRLSDDDFTGSVKAAKKDTSSPNENEKTGSKKEDMAKAIARSMAAAAGNSSKQNAQSEGVTDFSDYFEPQDTAAYSSVKTAERSAGSAERKSGSSAKKKTSANSAKNGKNSKNPSKKKGKKKKKSSAGKKAAIILSACVVVMCAGAGGLYLAGLNAYKGVFLDNTYINGIDVSGMTQADAAKAVEAASDIPKSVVITKKDGSTISIKMEDIGYKDSTKEKVTEFYKQQDHYSWLSSKFNETEYKIDHSFKYDKKSLEEILKRKVVDAQTTITPEDAYIKETEDGSGVFTIVNEVNGDKVDTDKIDVLYKYVESALDEDTFEINISGVDCYEKAKVTAADLQEDCDHLNNLSNIELTFDFNYTTEVLEGSEIMDWIEFDADDPAEGYTVDKDKAMTYVEKLADKYDTFGKDRTFKTTNRGTITMPQGDGCYGWWIDQEKTRDLICELIEAGESAETEPVYYVNPYSSYTYTCDPDWRTADTDYSNTYFEVDLSAQHMWYYENGVVKMESDIVSGYPSESRNTPAGVYKLWLKERGKTLTGSSDGKSYSSYVEYWNNISTISIGFHDASWQNGVFGGEKYKSSTWGSHGCINLPFDKAKYIYENCAEGTPVFAYWS